MEPSSSYCKTFSFTNSFVSDGVQSVANYQPPILQMPQILPILHPFFKILQDSSRFFKILQDSSRFCQILPDSARFFRFRLRFGAQDSVATSDRGRPRRVQPIGMQGNPETLPEVEEMPAGDGTLDLMDAAVALDSTLRDSRRH